MTDLIDRQAAIDAIVNTVSSIGRYDNTAASYGAALRQNEIIDTIEKLPSAQPERKKGKWKLNKDGNWACPFCEFDPYHDNMKGMNYCPNCGARMVKEDE